MPPFHLASQSSVPLPYTIAQCSAHSGRYAAENILVDNPTDQASRWSGAYQGNTKQWILLCLDSLAILKSITFGKYWKSHPCNMKEFKVYVGVTSDHLTEVLHAGLKNDSTPETFNLKHHNVNGVCFPTRFVKIIPLSAHGQSFHTSIWSVAMAGVLDENIVSSVSAKYDEFRETAVLRQILKHLRQRRLLTPYQDILLKSGLQFEHPLITQLHESVVLEGNWTKAEKLLDAISRSGLFNTYIHGCQPHASWMRLNGTDPDGDVPSPRGGHAMCIDTVNDMIYLFGGWDGQKSLDDFWVYDINRNKWRILTHETSNEQNAPGARSCHKMVFDTKTGSIYILGRLSEMDAKAPASPDSTKAYCSEFYRYHSRGIDSGKWDFLSFDTASSGGPPLIFDHQMVLDCDTQMIYVFGGRVVDGDWDSVKYSGLYSYNIRTSKWKLLQHPENSSATQVIVPSRFGHSMVLEPIKRVLYIFAGQRDEKYLSDMYAYDIATNTATELFSNFTSSGGPDACFTQRAVIDPGLKELYIFCGLTRNPHATYMNALQSECPNWVYKYDQRPGTWTRILPLSSTTSGDGAVHGGDSDRGEDEEPVPRYAHQVVYNPKTRVVYMHGGNAGLVGIREGLESTRSVGGSGAQNANRSGYGESGSEAREGSVESSTPSVNAAPEREKDTFREGGAREKRLDDFWRMSLVRPAPEEIIRRAKFRIRRQQFREMCEEEPPVKALNFLQTQVSSVVDHSNQEETETFRSLLTLLLAPSPPRTSTPGPTSSASAVGLLSLSSSQSTSTNPGSLQHRRKLSRSGVSQAQQHSTRSVATSPPSISPVEGGRGEGGDEDGEEEGDGDDDGDGVRPRKRSRPNTPEEEWTNVLHEEDEDGLGSADEEFSSRARTQLLPSVSEGAIHDGVDGGAGRSHSVKEEIAGSRAKPEVSRLREAGRLGQDGGDVGVGVEVAQRGFVVSAPALRAREDPYERERSRKIRSGLGGAGTSSGAVGGGGGGVSGKRFEQRNAVFESLLEFVGAEDKQPEGSLLDLVDGGEAEM